MTMFPWSQNGETTGAPFAGSPSLAPVACLPSRRPLRLPTCLCSSGTEGTTLPHITHLSSFCHPWSPSSKSRNLYLGGKGGTSLSKSTIPPPRVGGTDQRGRGGRQAANVAKQQEGTTETRGLERDSGGGGKGRGGGGSAWSRKPRLQGAGSSLPPEYDGDDANPAQEQKSGSDQNLRCQGTAPGRGTASGSPGLGGGGNEKVTWAGGAAPGKRGFGGSVLHVMLERFPERQQVH